MALDQKKTGEKILKHLKEKTPHNVDEKEFWAKIKTDDELKRLAKTLGVKTVSKK